MPSTAMQSPGIEQKLKISPELNALRTFCSTTSAMTRGAKIKVVTIRSTVVIRMSCGMVLEVPERREQQMKRLHTRACKNCQPGVAPVCTGSKVAGEMIRISPSTLNGGYEPRKDNEVDKLLSRLKSQKDR